jgi:hypothetical protein
MTQAAWIPAEFQYTADNAPFMLSANHRGDMYHIRAALIAGGHPDTHPVHKHARPLILYECDDGDKGNKQLQDYLIELARGVFKQNVLQVPWGMKDFFRMKGGPPSTASCRVNGAALARDLDKGKDLVQQFAWIVEGVATKEFAESVQNVKGEYIDKTLAPLMAGVTTDFDMKTWEGKFEGLAPSKVLQDIVKSKHPSILIMYRETGHVEGGAYPELDSGLAMWDLVDIVKSIQPANDKWSEPVLCGHPSADAVVKSPDGKHHAFNIGQYFLALKKVDASGLCSRSVEAAYLLWAYRRGYFSMLIGFRSGPLDLLTFLGIPTVSIGLRDMIGEPRHALLADPRFKRQNVQYEHARHDCTAWIKGRGNKSNPPLLQCPYWTSNDPSKATPSEPLYAPPPDGATAREPPSPIPASPVDQTSRRAGEKKAVESPPENFTPFDKSTVEYGVRLAIQQYLPPDLHEKSFTMKPSAIPPVFTAEAMPQVSLAGIDPGMSTADLKQKDDDDTKAWYTPGRKLKLQMTDDMVKDERTRQLKRWGALHGGLKM